MEPTVLAVAAAQEALVVLQEHPVEGALAVCVAVVLEATLIITLLVHSVTIVVPVEFVSFGVQAVHTLATRQMFKKD
jgi:hypothetical protein